MINLLVALLLVAAPQDHGFDKVSILGTYQGVYYIKLLSGDEIEGAAPKFFDWRKARYAVINIQITNETGGQYYLKVFIRHKDVYDLALAVPPKTRIGITGSHRQWRNPDNGEYELIIDADELVVIN